MSVRPRFSVAGAVSRLKEELRKLDTAPDDPRAVICRKLEDRYSGKIQQHVSSLVDQSWSDASSTSAEPSAAKAAPTETPNTANLKFIVSASGKRGSGDNGRQSLPQAPSDCTLEQTLEETQLRSTPTGDSVLRRVSFGAATQLDATRDSALVALSPDGVEFSESENLTEANDQIASGSGFTNEPNITQDQFQSGQGAESVTTQGVDSSSVSKTNAQEKADVIEGRPKRHRIKPCRFWLLERPKYRRKNGLDSLVGVTVDSVAAEEGKRSKRRKDQASDGSIYVPKKKMKNNPGNLRELRRHKLLMEEKNLQWEVIGDPSKKIKAAIIYHGDDHDDGFLLIPGLMSTDWLKNTEKPLRGTVINGKVDLTVDKDGQHLSAILGNGFSFEIPAGAAYCLENVKETKCKILFSGKF